MQWTSDHLNRLLNFRSNLDSDDIMVKERIKRVLLDNIYILHVLHNKELEDAEAEADEYFNTCILPYYNVHPTQTDVQNYICYEVNYDEVKRYNKSFKMLEIVFHILCHHEDLIDRETGVARHDLLAALLQDAFNYTNYFGSTIQLISDVSGNVDNDYASRVLVFQQQTDNNLVKTRNGQPRLINKDIVTFAEES